MPTNTAAWLVSPRATPLEIKSTSYTPPKEDQIVIKVAAVAINPVDWLLQEQGTTLMFPWLKYPFVLGVDVAGEVVEVGSHVTRFTMRDRVLGQAVGQDKARNDPSEGGFQTYVVLLARMTSPIPDNMSYEQACVIPLGLSTAACGLFEEDQLHLQKPNFSSQTSTPTGETVLIWGGSTSVGCNAIQLATAAGYEVVTTCSPKNFELVKRLGATNALDYNSPTVIGDVLSALQGKTCAGALSIGAGSADACMNILHQCKNVRHKFVAMATYPAPSSPSQTLSLLRTVFTFMMWNVQTVVKSKIWGVGWKFIFATSLVENGVGKAMYEDFLPQALATGRYVAAPDPVVVGRGLESIQEAMDIQRKGVSAKKIVVLL